MEPIIPEGFIILARKIRKSSLWQSLKATHRIVMIELLLQAQFKDGEVVRNGEILHLKRGQVATSYQQLVDDISDKDIKVKVVRNAIEKLVKHDFLAKDEAKAKAKKGLLLTVVNYGVYQDSDNYKGKDKGKVKGIKGAKQGQSKGKAGAINKNGNKDNNFNNDIKHKYAEFVSMKEEEYQKLIDRYGQDKTNKMIEALDNYKGANGKTYKSDYRAILTWVADKVINQKPTPGKPIKQDKLPEWIDGKHEPIKPKDITDAEKRKIMEERLKKLGEWEEPNEPNQS
jgi:hypothetical protein